MKHIIFYIVLSFLLPEAGLFAQQTHNLLAQQQTDQTEQQQQVKKKKKKKKKKRKKRRKKRRKSKATGSSKIRGGQMFSLALNFGMAFDNTLGIGGSAYYHLSNDFHIGGSFLWTPSAQDVSGNIENSNTAIKITQGDMTSYQVALNTRYFFTDTTFVTAGLGQRGHNLLFLVDTITADEYIDLTMSAQAIMIYAAVGNIWSFSWGGHVGAEWLGATLPASGSVTSSVETNSADDSTTFTDIRQDIESYAEGVSTKPMMMLAIVYAGFSF